jgi:hypothetical protein
MTLTSSLTEFEQEFEPLLLPRAMEGDKPSLDSAHEALKAEAHSEADRPTVQYRLYKRRFTGLVALVSRGC